ncbi:hypothetical protein FA10DRAFT_290815 [Acaromyces ingoldii]|uniref:Uncharacterized protein n=1 Tax=Acaromyces ingoldii TaxID=215250 RepID=A0A316Z049_9BASI|nr:hypothetical protein FA10DRAFT_290815 [Acaromyces ingoldii]PWN93663.1 hypothetical protein FA10DRAFT_290815 [Acaromyces ingoldii]
MVSAQTMVNLALFALVGLLSPFISAAPQGGTIILPAVQVQVFDQPGCRGIATNSTRGKCEVRGQQSNTSCLTTKIASFVIHGLASNSQPGQCHDVTGDYRSVSCEAGDFCALS